MVNAVQHAVSGDLVKAALHYLKTFYETEKIPNFIPSEDPKWLQLMVYLRKNTGEARTLDVTFPHDFKTHKIYLFTKNEPNMSIKETENFYETFLHQNDVRQKIEIIPLSKVHTSMPWLKKNGTFLVDKRIHSDLLTQLGGYWRRELLAVDLKSSDLVEEVNRHIPQRQIAIGTDGCVSSVHVGDMDMKEEELMENILEAVETLAEKLPEIFETIDCLCLKTLSSIVLPIYTHRQKSATPRKVVEAGITSGINGVSDPEYLTVKQGMKTEVDQERESVTIENEPQQVSEVETTTNHKNQKKVETVHGSTTRSEAHGPQQEHALKRKAESVYESESITLDKKNVLQRMSEKDTAPPLKKKKKKETAAPPKKKKVRRRKRKKNAAKKAEETEAPLNKKEEETTAAPKKKDTAAPPKKKKNTATPSKKKEDTATPLEIAEEISAPPKKKGTATPQKKKETAAPPKKTEETAAPPEKAEETTSPPAKAEETCTPLKKKKKDTASPLKEAEAAATPLKKKEDTATPLKKKDIATPLKEAEAAATPLKKKKEDTATPLKKKKKDTATPLKKKKKDTATPLKEAEAAATPLKKKKDPATPLKEAEAAATPLKKKKKDPATPLKEAEAAATPLKNKKKDTATPLKKAEEAADTPLKKAEAQDSLRVTCSIKNGFKTISTVQVSNGMVTLKTERFKVNEGEEEMESSPSRNLKRKKEEAEEEAGAEVEEKEEAEGEQEEAGVQKRKGSLKITRKSLISQKSPSKPTVEAKKRKAPRKSV